MSLRPKPLSQKMQREWIELGHKYVANSIFFRASELRAEIAMQGGCALRLFFDAPRFSMDMDFVMNAEHQRDLDSIIAAVQRDVTREFQRDLGPETYVRLRGGPKADKKLVRYTLTVINQAKFQGAANLFLEFWPVSPEYMQHYAKPRTIPESGLTINRADEFSISTPTLKNIYIDKVVALSGRSRIKWRDIYDIWWISTRLQNWLPAPENAREMTTMFLDQAGAYEVGNPEVALRGLQRFLETDTDVLLDQAYAELGQFLDRQTLATLFWYGEGVPRIINRAKLACQIVHDNLEHRLYGTPSTDGPEKPNSKALFIQL